MRHWVLLILTMASVVSMAAPVKSVVGGKEIALGEDCGLSAKAYIQDGLVAMWDGIENAGWGVHDPNATVWKDLTDNGKDFVWEISTQGISWDSNHLKLANNNKTNASVAAVANVTGLTNRHASRTVEIVMALNWAFQDSSRHIKPFVLVGATFAIGRYNNQVVPCILRTPGDYEIGYRETGITINDWKIVSTSIANAPSNYNCILHANGGSYSVGTNFATKNTQDYDKGIIYRTGYADARLYSVRIYNRALTAEEAAHNYEIDKARFNLP